jgi:hypothetical protein
VVWPGHPLEHGVLSSLRECGASCPQGRRCVSGMADYNGQPLPDLCMLGCEVSADCGGSECDMPSGVSERYCF